MFFSLKSTLTTCLEHREGIYKEGLGGGKWLSSALWMYSVKHPFFPLYEHRKVYVTQKNKEAMKKKKKRKGRSKTPQLHKPRCQPYLLCDGIWGISQWPEHDSNMPGAKSRGRHLTLHNNSGMQAITNADLIYASLSYIQSYLLEMCSLHSTYPQGAVRSHHETGARTPVLSQPHTTALAQQGWKPGRSSCEATDLGGHHVEWPDKSASPD